MDYDRQGLSLQALEHPELETDAVRDEDDEELDTEAIRTEGDADLDILKASRTAEDPDLDKKAFS